jgi:nucleotide-binding universal stress UspA family protein
VVVGYDGSQAARRALTRAADEAGAGGRLVVVAAADTPGEVVAEDAAGLVRRARAEWLRDAAARLAGKDVDVSTRLVESEPAEALVEAATASGARLIVVGARGASFVARAIRGPVAEKLVSRAPCDVLVVR